MTKPHEEEWEQDAEYVDIKDGPTILKAWDDGEGGHFARARLASKAPKMANLLARVLDEHGAYMPYTAHDIEDVLREAGVLE